MSDMSRASKFVLVCLTYIKKRWAHLLDWIDYAIRDDEDFFRKAVWRNNSRYIVEEDDQWYYLKEEYPGQKPRKVAKHMPGLVIVPSTFVPRHK